MTKETIIAEIREEYLTNFSFDGSAGTFVSSLDTLFDHIYEDAVERHYKAPPWDLPGVRLAICCFLAWGEVRSVDVFTRQAVELGYEYPELRLLLSKQIYEEMVHHQMFRKAAIKMGGVDPLTVQAPSGIMAMFDAYNYTLGSTDILEKIFYGQFSSERAAIPSFKRIKESIAASRSGLPPVMEKAFDRVEMDEPGHIAVGRRAALELAKRGAEQRRRMIELALDIIGITINLWITETKNYPAIIKFAASLIKAKTKAKIVGLPEVDDAEWNSLPDGEFS